MALYGQRFRVFTYDSTAQKYKVVGMATSCTINMINNTEDASHKDIVGLAKRPDIVSKSWNVQVESLSVADVGALMTAMKNGTVFKLMWDIVSASDNQTPEGNVYNTTGNAYLTDATFQFDNRANSTKSLQFTGTSDLTFGAQEENTEAIAVSDTYTKGQSVRLFLSNDNTTTPTKVITYPQSLSLHVSVSVENSTTKEATELWESNVPTELSYDISTSGLIEGNETITSGAGSVGGWYVSDLQDIYNNDAPVKWFIANTNGINNRSKVGNPICSGSVLITNLGLSAPNRQVCKYDMSLVGVGDYTVGS